MVISVDLSFKPFRKRVALFAYRRWAKGSPDRRKPVGVPGNRDPEMPCASYSPRPHQLGDWNDCKGDGHYECRNCCHLDTRPDSNEE